MPIVNGINVEPHSNLSGVDLSGVDLSNLNLTGINFTRAIFRCFK